MTRYRLFIAGVCAALVTVGCRGGSESDPIPATLPGSYVYAARGSTLKKPWEFAARLELTADKRYKFTLDKTMDGEKDPTETSVGTYAVSGDHLMIHDSDDEGTASKDLHKLLIKADSLIAEVGWTAEIFLKGVGAPNVVFVKERRG
ncbi:MAG: hypothetical protein M3P26_08710 [Gemmatimonadota bacterium]|nr:hypothetical protein [Gemmatimonadota bacterium]